MAQSSQSHRNEETNNNTTSTSQPQNATSSTPSNPNQTSPTSSPPPPPPRHPFYSLPVELILSIVDFLPPESFINFAFANYPLLLKHGLAPSLSGSRVAHLTTETQIPAMFPLLMRLPPEITLQVLRHLNPADVMRFVLANYQILAHQGIAPPLTTETVGQLVAAVRSEGGVT